MNALLRWIRELAVGDDKKGNIHITIRGPYAAPLPPTQISRYRRLLSSNPLVFEGAGSFQLPDREVVFLKVQHPQLRQVWWKPDFPPSKFGFNPHITLYEGSDHVRANCLLQFLKREQLSLLTSKFEVTSQVTNQNDLFVAGERPVSAFLGLVNSGRACADVLIRLARALRVGVKVA